MKKFEVNKTYQTRSACDHECIFEIKVVKRTEKSVVVEGDWNKRCKIYHDNNGEYIVPANYSFAPVFRA